MNHADDLAPVALQILLLLGLGLLVVELAGWWTRRRRDAWTEYLEALRTLHDRLPKR